MAPVVAGLKRVGWWLNTRLPRRWRRSVEGTLHASLGGVVGSFDFVGVATGWSPCRRN